MPNSIELFKQYVTLLDEVYKLASLTGVLDGASELARQGSNANELIDVDTPEILQQLLQDKL